MLHIGQILRQARIKRGMSLIDVEQKTKIKREFISAIEQGKWQILPDFPVVVGFVKNLGNLFGLSPDKAVAFLRRDYPKQMSNTNPKPDVSIKKLTWSPKFTFAIGIVTVILIVTGYVVYQYSSFIRPPELNLTLPVEGQNISENSVQVLGVTDENSTLTVNSQPVLVEADGSFSTNITVADETGEIVVKSVSRSGKETVVKRKVNIE